MQTQLCEGSPRSTARQNIPRQFKAEFIICPNGSMYWLFISFSSKKSIIFIPLF